MHTAKRGTDVNSIGTQKETHIGKKTEVDETQKHPPTHTHKSGGGGQKANPTDNQVRFQRLVYLMLPLFIAHLPQAKLCSVHAGSNRRVAISLPWWTLHCGGASESEEKPQRK